MDLPFRVRVGIAASREEVGISSLDGILVWGKGLKATTITKTRNKRNAKTAKTTVDFFRAFVLSFFRDIQAPIPGKCQKRNPNVQTPPNRSPGAFPPLYQPALAAGRAAMLGY
jgi:hypothetical protein